MCSFASSRWPWVLEPWQAGERWTHRRLFAPCCTVASLVICSASEAAQSCSSQFHGSWYPSLCVGTLECCSLHFVFYFVAFKEGRNGVKRSHQVLQGRLEIFEMTSKLDHLAFFDFIVHPFHPAGYARACQAVLGGRVDVEKGKCQYNSSSKLTKVPEYEWIGHNWTRVSRRFARGSTAGESRSDSCSECSQSHVGICLDMLRAVWPGRHLHECGHSQLELQKAQKSYQTGCRRWWIMVLRSHVEIATLDTAKDTSQKSEPMQRSWCSQPLRTPWSWLDAVQSQMRTQGSVKLRNGRYLIIQVPALYVDNQNPQIGLKAGKVRTCKVYSVNGQMSI